MDVNAGEETLADFILNAGYISGTVSVGNDLTLSGGNIHADLNSDGKYVNAGTSLTVSESEGSFSFPVQAYDEIKVSAAGITTTSGNYYNLVSQLADVTQLNTTVVNWEFDPVSAISGNFSLNGLGMNIVDSHRISVGGAWGGKSTTISDNGDYSLTYLLPGVYNFSADSYLNSGDDYFRPPDSSFDSSVTVPSEGTLVNDVLSNAAFVNGKLIFGPSADKTVATFPDVVTSANIYGHGIAPGTSKGCSRDKIDVSTGNYDLILSEGKWNIYKTDFELYKDHISFCGHEPVYLKSDMKIDDYARTADFDNEISLNDGQSIDNHDITYETGAVTLCI